MHCSSEETETSGKASQRVALEMNIEEGGSEVGQRSRQREYAG